ncbi:MAG: HEAT repeat domain-containing protein [Elusimicrobiota bacterium]
MKKIFFLMVLFFLVNNSQRLFGSEINTLIKQLKSDDNKGRAVAIKNLEKKGAEVIPDLIKALETATTRLKKLQTVVTSTELQKEYRYRGDIIIVLSRTKDERGIEPIGNILLKSMDKEERLTAAIGLGIVENKKAIPILKQALQDEDTKVGLRAAYSLGRLGDDSGYTLATKKNKR